MIGSESAIGVFDSGIGGLTVVGKLLKDMPNERIIYFGDTARVPYGSKSKEVITRFAIEISDFLVSQEVKAIVVACNTVSATCLDLLRSRYEVPVFGVVEPGVLAVKDLTKTRRGKKPVRKIGIIGTRRTVNSNAYKDNLLREMPLAEVYQNACPLFVPLAEEGFRSGQITDLTVAHYLKEMKETGIDALILGCTHYPLLQAAIEKYCGKSIEIIDPSWKLSEMLREFLAEKDLLNASAEPQEPVFYLSDSISAFSEISRLTCGKEYEQVIISLF